MIRLFRRYCGRQTLLHVVCDLGLIFLVFAGAYLFLLEHGAGHAVPATHGLSVLAGMLFVNTAAGLYRRAAGCSVHQWWVRAALALALALLLAYLAFEALPPDFAQGVTLRWVTMLCVAGVVAHRIYAAHANAASRPYSRVLILGTGSSAQLVGRTIADARRPMKIVGYIPGPNESQSSIDASELLSEPIPLRDRAVNLGVKEVIVALTERRGGGLPMSELLDCRSAGVRISDLSTYFERMLGQIRIDQLHPGWLIFGKGFNHSVYRDVAKRLFDIACSCVLLAMALPLLILTAVCIAVESRGPVFYRQERVGQGGRTFSVLKFRSMCVDAERNGTPQWATAKDARVTRVGSIIRRYRIDEFPQLVNVLKGEMSLVGPRPERSFFVEQLTAQIPFYALRHTVKPGVTGWAQVRYDYGASIEDSLEKLQYDLYYVKNHSLFLDVRVLAETVSVVLSGRGAR
jgi:sugar transferase (PEP-CTERM system associated)